MGDLLVQDIETAEDCFFRDILTLREQARRLIAPAAGDPGGEISIALLQNVLATEIVCVLRYTTISVSPIGFRNPELANEFQAQARDERRHMEMAARRIRQLGGVPEFSPPGLTSANAGFAYATLSLIQIIQQNLALEKRIVEHYRELLVYFTPKDPPTAFLLQTMLQDEENHSADLRDFLEMQNRLDAAPASWEIREL
jgi:bacterioferritin